MKTTILLFAFVLAVSTALKAQETTTETTAKTSDTVAFIPETQQGQNLDLSAVLEVFKDSKGLEDFEKNLNKEDGINNLDLNGDSLVDYIRVLETEEGEYRIVVLQAIVADNEFQDVAYINIKKKDDKNIEVQVEGNRVIYGESYYVSPEPTVHVNVYLWPMWGYMYYSGYHYYSSPYYWGYYPGYYRPWRPYPYHYYHRRVVGYHHGYYYRRTPVVVRPGGVYTPRNSNRVTTTPTRPTGARPTKPGQPAQPATRQGKPGQSNAPSRKETPSKQATRPATRPITPQQKPATRPATPQHKPATRPTTPKQRPATRPTTPKQRPATRPSTPKQRPATRPSTPQRKPATRPATPQRRPAARPATPQRRPATSPGRR